LNIRLDCSEQDYRRFLYCFAETLADTNQRQIQRNEGGVVPTPPEPASRLTLDDLFADWKRLYQGGPSEDRRQGRIGPAGVSRLRG